MIQDIEFLSERRGSGLLLTSPERTSIFELSQLTGAAVKCVDEWIAAD